MSFGVLLVLKLVASQYNDFGFSLVEKLELNNTMYFGVKVGNFTIQSLLVSCQH